jgi:hypothetical protein
MSDFISLQKAIEMTTLYRMQMDTILADEYKGQDILVRSEVFSKEQVEKLLAKPGCAFLRIYYGMSQDLKIHALLVSADGNSEDILCTGEHASNEAAEDVLEEADRCPPICPPASPLNPIK